MPTSSDPTSNTTHEPAIRQALWAIGGIRGPIDEPVTLDRADRGTKAETGLRAAHENLSARGFDVALEEGHRTRQIGASFTPAGWQRVETVELVLRSLGTRPAAELAEASMTGPRSAPEILSPEDRAVVDAIRTASDARFAVAKEGHDAAVAYNKKLYTVQWLFIGKSVVDPEAFRFATSGEVVAGLSMEELVDGRRALEGLVDRGIVRQVMTNGGSFGSFLRGYAMVT